MAVAVNDILRVACQQKWDVFDQVNVLHFKVFATPTVNDDAHLLADIGEEIGNAYADMASVISNNTVADTITVFNVTQDRPHGITAFGSGYTGGTASGDGMPPQDFGVVLLSTGVKRRQGRIYVGSLPESRANNGVLDNTFRTAVATFVDDLLNPPVLTNGTELLFGVYSRKDGEFSDVTTVRVQSIIGSMDSRKRGRGS